MQQVFISLSREELQALFEASIKGILTGFKSEQVKKYYTRKELCSQLGISLPTLDNLVRTGQVKSYKIGSRILFKADEIDTFLKTQRFI